MAKINNALKRVYSSTNNINNSFICIWIAVLILIKKMFQGLLYVFRNIGIFDLGTTYQKSGAYMVIP